MSDEPTLERQPAPTMAPDGTKYWDGSEWKQLPGPVCEWDGFRWQAKPTGTESAWNGNQWAVKPVDEARWHNNQWHAKPPDLESRWDGEQWAIRPEGQAEWNGSEWLSKPEGDFRWNGTGWVGPRSKWIKPVVVLVAVVLLGAGVGFLVYQGGQAAREAAFQASPEGRCATSAQVIIKANSSTSVIENISETETARGVVCSGTVVERFDSGQERARRGITWDPEEPRAVIQPQIP